MLHLTPYSSQEVRMLLASCMLARRAIQHPPCHPVRRDPRARQLCTTTYIYGHSYGTCQHVHVHVVLSTLFSATVQLYSISKAGAALVGAQKYKTCLLSDVLCRVCLCLEGKRLSHVCADPCGFILGSALRVEILCPLYLFYTGSQPSKLSRHIGHENSAVLFTHVTCQA